MQLWVDKYRPKTLKDFVFRDEGVEKFIRTNLENKNCPHLILYGHRGAGKNSLANLLIKYLEIDETDVLVVNASINNKIDYLRGEVESFLGRSPLSTYKVVLFDEADQLTPAAQKSLKATIEQHSEDTRFFFLTNHIQKVSPEIRSRCQEIKFNSLDKTHVLAKVCFILGKEKVQYSSIEQIEQYVDEYYPDLRKIINTVQANSINGVLNDFDDESDPTLDVFVSILDSVLSGNWIKARKIASENLNADQWEPMYRFLYEISNEVCPEAVVEAKFLTIVAEYLYRHASVADPEINATAMFIKLTGVFAK